MSPIVEARVTKHCTDMHETQDSEYGFPPRVLPSLLLVDDDPLVRESLGELLTELPYPVHIVAGGTEALDTLSSHPDIALLITDIMMPEMDGLTLARNARASNPHLRVLFLSGLQRPWGAEEFLAKPVSALDLLARVERLMGERVLTA